MHFLPLQKISQKRMLARLSLMPEVQQVVHELSGAAGMNRPHRDSMLLCLNM